jgi:hypothetical protein
LSPKSRTIAVLVAAAGLAYAATPAVFALDDAYIAQHSARVLLSGDDPAYGTSALVGATSPPYVLLLSLFTALGLPALHLTSALGLVAFGAALWALGRTLQLSVLDTVALCGISIASGFVLTNALNGIETGWAFAAVTWLIVVVLRGQTTAVACIAGLLPAIRPDLGPTAALVLCCALWDRSWAERLRMASIAAAVALPWFLWVRTDTGEWLPQTMRAKQLWFAEACWPLAKKVWSGTGYIRHVMWQILPLALALIALLFHRLGRIGLLAAAVTLTAYVLLLPGGIHYNYFRYPYAIVLPWGCFGLAFLLKPEVLSRGVRQLVIASSVLFVVYAQTFAAVREAQAADARELVNVAVWIDEHIPPDAVVLVHDAGVVSEFAHRRLVDIVGLKTPSSIDAHARWTGPSCGADRRTALAEIARASRASYLVVVDHWDRIYSISKGLTEAGFTLTAVRRPAVRPGFFVYRISEQRLAGTAG